MENARRPPTPLARGLVFALAPTVGAGSARTVRDALPFARYLERSLGLPVRLIIESSYDSTVAALREGRIDAAMLGVFASLKGQATGAVEPLVTMVGPDGQLAWYQSVLVTRIDSGIHDPASLRGRVVGLVDPQSTSGYLMPRAMLREAGVDPDRDLTVGLLGTHEAVVQAVIAGDVAAGGVHVNHTRPPNLDRGPDYARLRILATSRPIPRGPLVVRADLPPELRRDLTDALLRLPEADQAAADVLISTGRRFTLASRGSAPTLKSIAALAGVSYGTVSRAINGAGDVAPDTAARIAAIVKELGYRPSSHAVSLRRRPTPIVGLVVPLDLDQPLRGLVDPLRADLAAAGVPLVLCPTDGPPGGSVYLDMLLDDRLGALVVPAPHAADPTLVEAARSGRIVVAVGLGTATPGILVASQECAAQAVLTALGLGPGRVPATHESAR